jgi:hypothetical protein
MLTLIGLILGSWLVGGMIAMVLFIYPLLVVSGED